MEQFVNIPGEYVLAAIGILLAALAGVVSYYQPEREYGPEYSRKGRVKEVDFESSKDWTSGGFGLSSNGSVDYSTQSHHIPEKYQVIIDVFEANGRRQETLYLDDSALYEAVEKGEKVEMIFRDVFLRYRDGTQKPVDRRDLIAVVVEGERIEVA
jgi:hypothetical protein